MNRFLGIIVFIQMTFTCYAQESDDDVLFSAPNSQEMIWVDMYTKIPVDQVLFKGKQADMQNFSIKIEKKNNINISIKLGRKRIKASSLLPQSILFDTLKILGGDKDEFIIIAHYEHKHSHCDSSINGLKSSRIMMRVSINGQYSLNYAEIQKDCKIKYFSKSGNI